MKLLGNEKQSLEVEEKLSREVSSRTIYPADKDAMYYFVREGLSKDPYHHSRHSEGFCKELSFTSQMTSGKVYIDGSLAEDFGIGDEFKVDMRPEYDLTCVKLEV